jgi:LCP family protein required for cell wall assembly
MDTARNFLSRITRRKWLMRAMALVLVISVSCVAAIGAFAVSRHLTLNNYAVIGAAGPELVEGQATLPAGESAPPVEAGMNVPQVEPELTPWDGAGRVTVLLLGLDYRDWEAGTDYSRSDTMILLTLDPLSRTAGILSIPRDMWVAIPGFQHGKINTAYYLGEAHKLPGGGPGLAVKTVEQFLGVPINFYAQIDFNAFVRFIDEIGGVKVNIPEPITVDMLGDGYRTRKKLQPGIQVLPGEIALAYARARHSEGGDFDRAERQQQVILGIRNRILRFDMLPVLIEKKDILYQELASGVHTNMTLDQLVRLAVMASQVPEENIKRGVLGKGFVLFGTSPDNLAILIPLADKIHTLRDDIFASSGALGPQTPGNELERMLAEAAQVAVQNQSRTAGLAERTNQFLESNGVIVSSVVDAPGNLTVTTLIDHTGNPFTAKYLVNLMGINPAKIIFEEDPGSQVDIELILGDDWARGIPQP